MRILKILRHYYFWNCPSLKQYTVCYNLKIYHQPWPQALFMMVPGWNLNFSEPIKIEISNREWCHQVVRPCVYRKKGKAQASQWCQTYKGIVLWQSAKKNGDWELLVLSFYAIFVTGIIKWCLYGFIFTYLSRQPVLIPTFRQHGSQMWFPLTSFRKQAKLLDLHPNNPSLHSDHEEVSLSDQA